MHRYSSGRITHFSYVRESSSQSGRPGTSWSLSDAGLGLHHERGGHPPAVLYFDPPRLGPFAHLGVVHSASRSPASAPNWPPGAAATPPCHLYTPRQRIPQGPSMLGVQVNFIVGAVQSEATVAPFPTGKGATMERIGWPYSDRVLRARVAELRPVYLPPDAASRTSYAAGELAQDDFWFPEVEWRSRSGAGRSGRRSRCRC